MASRGRKIATQSQLKQSCTEGRIGVSGDCKVEQEDTNHTMFSNQLYRKPNERLPVAPANALLNCFLSRDCPRLTMVLVTVVPMLAPIIIAIAGRIVMTGEK